MIDTILSGINEKVSGMDPIGNSILFELGDNYIHVDGNGASNVVTTEKKDADCTISCSPETFAALVSGELNPMGAVMGGKVKISGNMGVAMKLQSLFS